MRRLQLLIVGLFIGAVSVGCPATEREPVVVPDAQPGTGPTSRPPQAVPPSAPAGQSDTIPVERSATEEDINE